METKADKRYIEELLNNEYILEEYKLEKALKEIEDILNGAVEMYCCSKSMHLDEEDIEDILDIIKRTKEK